MKALYDYEMGPRQIYNYLHHHAKAKIQMEKLKMLLMLMTDKGVLMRWSSGRYILRSKEALKKLDRSLNRKKTKRKQKKAKLQPATIAWNLT